MSDNITPLHPERKPRARRKIRRIVGIVVAALLLALVIVVVVVAVRNDLTDLGAVQRFLRYMNSSSKEEFGSYSYDSHDKNRFAAFDDGLAIASVSGLTLLDDMGEEQLYIASKLSAPALSTDGKRLLCYDIGGSSLILANASHGALLELQTEGAILDASLSEGGAMCYLTSEGNYKAVIPVYNSKQENIYVWYSASVYYNQCAVSPDASCLAAIAIGQQGAQFQSSLTLIRTDAEEPFANIPLGDQLIYELRFLSNGVICLWSEDGLQFYSDAGEQLGVYQPEGTITAVSLEADGFATVWLESDLAGAQASVVTVKENGSVRGSVAFASEILDFSANGDYVAVLTTDALHIFNGELSLYAETDECFGAVQVKLREDGSAVLISGANAELYIP